nr:glutathione ABC transporter substrate-binding protein GsiB [uncultured Albidiferax sp.]
MQHALSPLSKLSAALAVAAALACTASPAFAAKNAVIAVDSTFTTLDPYDANDTLSQAVAKSFYQGLLGFDKSMKMVPVLAESYKASKDGLNYTFVLKKGIKFQDGTDFNAEAVKANFDRVTNPDNKLKRYTLYKNIAKTEVLDANTVRIVLKEPFSPFINSLAHPSAVMISPAAIAKYGKAIGQNPVGTGPFKFVEWKQTDYVKAEKFAGYWRKGYPKVDSITWRPVVDNNSRSAIMQTGEANFTYPVPPEQVELLKGKPNLEITVSPSIVHRFVTLNTQHKPFDNLKVREALNYAINKDALIKVVYGGYAIPAEGVIPKDVQFSTKLGPWPYNPVKARELLKEAGYPNGFDSTLWSAFTDSTSLKAIQFIQQQLRVVGVNLQVLALEAGQRAERVESAPDAATAPVRMYYVGWSASTGEADWAIRPLLAAESFPPKSFNVAYYKNDAVEAGIAKALVTTDPAIKAQIYADVQQRVWKDAPWIHLATLQLVSARTKNFSGFYVMPDRSFNFDEIELK